MLEVSGSPQNSRTQGTEVARTYARAKNARVRNPGRRFLACNEYVRYQLFTSRYHSTEVDGLDHWTLLGPVVACVQTKRNIGICSPRLYFLMLRQTRSSLESLPFNRRSIEFSKELRAQSWLTRVGNENAGQV